MWFVMNAAKIWYGDARPFWISGEVWAYKCSLGYGNPSGHSLMTIGMALLLALDYQKEGRGKQVAIAAAILFGLLTAYTRVILGVHSIDQVVFGLSIGTWLAIAFEFQFKGIIYAMIDKLDARGIKMNLFVAFVAVMTQMLLCWVDVPRLNQSMLANIESRCGVINPNKAFGVSALMTAFVPSWSCAAYLGLVINSRYCNLKGR